jgi:hypothetical protein
MHTLIRDVNARLDGPAELLACHAGMTTVAEASVSEK